MALYLDSRWGPGLTSVGRGGSGGWVHIPSPALPGCVASVVLLNPLGLDRLICEMGRLITPISHGREDFMSQRIPVERGPALSKFSTMIHCYYLKCIIIPQGEKALEVDSCFSGWFFEFLSRYLSSLGLSRPFWNFLGMCVAPPSSCFPRFLSCYFLAASTLDGGASEILRCV